LEEETMQLSCASAILATFGFSFSLSIGFAYGGEKTLEFRMAVKYFDARALNAANIEDQTITQAKGFGVAVFKDGRLGTVDFIMAIDRQKGAGTAFGYGTYTFDDGSITERFTLAINGQAAQGEYKILSGTGAYAGATGSGTLESISNPYTADRLYNVKLRIVSP
jgi:hypothetical protein